MNKITFLLPNLAATAKLAEICQSLSSPVLFCLFGNLGTGKTQFVKFFAQFLGITQPIISPSFLKMCLYHTPHTKKTLAHFDGYHLNSHSDLGIYQDYLDSDYVFIEWPEFFLSYLDVASGKIIELTWVVTSDHLTRKVEMTAKKEIVDKIKLLCQEKNLVIL